MKYVIDIKNNSCCSNNLSQLPVSIKTYSAFITVAIFSFLGSNILVPIELLHIIKAWDLSLPCTLH